MNSFLKNRDCRNEISLHSIHDCWILIELQPIHKCSTPKITRQEYKFSGRKQIIEKKPKTRGDKTHVASMNRLCRSILPIQQPPSSLPKEVGAGLWLAELFTDRAAIVLVNSRMCFGISQVYWAGRLRSIFLWPKMICSANCQVSELAVSNWTQSDQNLVVAKERKGKWEENKERRRQKTVGR